jgi:hypothetical protein
MAKKKGQQFAVCVKNEDYPASLEVRKIYEVLPDDKAARHGMVRIIDESGEDYLYPVDYFVPIEIPEAAETVFLKASQSQAAV